MYNTFCITRVIWRVFHNSVHVPFFLITESLPLELQTSLNDAT